MRAVPKATPPVPGIAGGRALAEVHRVVDDVAAARGRPSDGEDDLLATLLRSGLPESTVRGEVTAFLLACVDEPTSALEAAWYLLAHDEPSEQRLHAELDAVLGGRAPEREDADRMPYLRAVLRETLRLFPPARHIDRCPTRDVRLGDDVVAAGSNVVVSPLVTQREPALYGRASEFVPERWLDGGGRDGLRGAYLPFGARAHACIGEPSRPRS
jgi:cytochrome P450